MDDLQQSFRSYYYRRTVYRSSETEVSQSIENKKCLIFFLRYYYYCRESVDDLQRRLDRIIIVGLLVDNL